MVRLGALGALVLGFALAQAGLPQAAASAAERPAVRQASLETERASADTVRLAAWVLATGDNQGLPFLIVDKPGARVFAFDAAGRLMATAAVLLGTQPGDDLIPGLPDRPLARIAPGERITPAGRFKASPGTNLSGKSILWIDYGASLSLHPVVTGVPAERRQHRLASATALDNRISFGCINVPAGFYETAIREAFAIHGGMVYILPESRTLEAVFGMPAVRSIL